ncbi:MAG: phosphoribosylanthranilate isomerase [Saprospiraceae bacterium]|nr:phosphoribosylanthranilate isomerase [Saprospiraceae bacterium]
MKIKVCGMRELENIQAASNLDIDYLGFIFYPKSKRYISRIPQIRLGPSTQRVGVFVNHPLEKVVALATENALTTLQLHGSETIAYCQALKHQGFQLIKAFHVNEDFDFYSTLAYESVCDFFLFDTKGKQLGGNGYAFDWNLLEQYQGNTAFFLSGGISLEDVDRLRALNLKQLYGVDLNSRFETILGVKNIQLLESFIQQLSL